MFKLKENILTVLEISSSKVVCMIAKIQGKRSEILGIGYVQSEGIRSGIISDVALAQNAVKKAIADAEKLSGIKAGKVLLCISSNYLISQCITTEISTISKNITHRELNKLLMDGIQVCKNRDLEVIHTFACNYILDGQHGISNPIGMFGNKLSCNFHVLSVSSNNLLNLQTVLSKTDLEIESYIAGIYASSLSVLSKDEFETGAILIDFGAEVTSFGVFENDQFVYTDSIPIGGKHITADIAKILCIPKTEAERLKNLYGVAIKNDIESNEIIKIFKDNEEINIRHDELIDIIYARLEEIIHILKLKTSEFKINNVVITGGASRIPLIKDLINSVFNCKTRIGHPQNTDFTGNNCLELTSVLGVINHVIENMKDDLVENNNVSERIHNKQNFLRWLKKIFF